MFGACRGAIVLSMIAEHAGSANLRALLGGELSASALSQGELSMLLSYHSITNSAGQAPWAPLLDISLMNYFGY
jgi:hypothetical protein